MLSLVFQFLCNIFALLLLVFQGNVGIVTVVLAVLIRLLIWPGYQKAIISQRKLSRIQPQIKKIQDKYQDDPVKANQEVLALFKKEKVSFSSIFFIFLQSAILILCFFFFRSIIQTDWSHYLYSFIPTLPALNYFFLGINLKLPSLVLALISAGINSVAVMLQPSQGQNKTLYLFLPFAILLFYKRIPAIILLFWVITGIIGLIQDYKLSRKKL